MEQDLKRLVARELHDRVAQTLTGMLMDVESFKSQQVGWDDVLRQLETVQSNTRQVLSSLRQLLYDLRGEEAVGDRFVDSVGALIARFEEKTRIKAQLSVSPDWPESLTPPASVNLYRIIEEALANVRLHSGASSVQIVLQLHSDDELAVLVDDDGRGVSSDESQPYGLGTIGMRERVLILGGRLRIEGQAGTGTTVQAIFPRNELTPHPPAATGLVLKT